MHKRHALRGKQQFIGNSLAQFQPQTRFRATYPWPDSGPVIRHCREVVMSRLLLRCVREEDGSEVVEYALMLGMLVLGCLVIMGALGVKIVDRWQEIFDAL